MFKKIFSLIKRLSSAPPVGGLEISDSAIRFLRIDRNQKITTASLRLPPGIVLDGKIKDRPNFLSALKTICSQLVKLKTEAKIHAVVSLPVSVVYSQSFGIPVIDQENIEETIELNFQMVSPLDLKKAYSDWQIVGENAVQKDVLGAFAESSIIDEYDSCLREAGFLPIAFEFPALSLARLIKNFGPDLDAEKSYILINVSNDGLNFVIIKKREMYFSHFVLWKTLQGEKKQIIFSDFKNNLVQETQKIINFLSVNYKESFEGAMIITSSLEKEIGEAIGQEFGLKVIPLRLRNYANFPPVWYTAFGSALRGSISRRQDNFISLMAHNVIDEFYHEQALSFISLWRNIFFVSLSAFLIIFGGTDIFLSGIQKKTEAQLASTASVYEAQGLSSLENKASSFNQLLTLVSAAKKSDQNWYVFFQQLSGLAGSKIIFDRILVQSLGAPVRIQGHADSQQTIVDFKNNLVSQTNLTNVDLPLTGIHFTGANQVNFEMSFSIKSLSL